MDSVASAVINSNNIDEIGLSKRYVSNASAYPPDELFSSSEDEDDDILIHNISDTVSIRFRNDMDIYPIIELNSDLSDTDYLDYVRSESNRYAYESSNGAFVDTNAVLLTHNASHNEYLKLLQQSEKKVIKHADDEKIALTTEINSKDRKWWITVPVKQLDDSIVYTKLLADPGANIGCVNTKWAIDNYTEFIVRNNKTHVIDTPNGKVHPEYAIFLRFPTKSGEYYRAKFVLLDDLPTPILADINMLEAFGYIFCDEVPPVFNHPAELDLDLEIKSNDRYAIHSDPRNNNNSINYNNSYECKSDSSESKSDTPPFEPNNNSKSEQLDNSDIFHVYKLNKILNCDESGHIPLCEKITNSDNLILFDESYKHDICAIDRMDYIRDYDKFADDLIDFQQRVYLRDTDLEMIYNNIISRQSYHIHNPYYFVANDVELKLAQEKIMNPKLQPINCEYIKTGAELINPQKYKNLYNETMKLINEFDDIFAKYMYDRRTLNIKPVRLNLKPECRNKRYNIDQYPINKDKRISVINETTHFDANGFWIPCDSSVHNTPYTVILKKPTAGGYVRARMAFDARQINNDCVLLEANYPTPKEFDDHYSRGFLTTTCDFKGYFDCIPVHPDDSEFLIVKTPLGLRKILHLSYGWKNSAANAQRITNQVCMEVGHMIGFIDDCSIRHPEEWGTQELIAHLRHFFEVCRKYNLLLHPEKFFPFALEVECLGIKRSIHGSEMTSKYKKKLLSLQKPTTPKELHAALGAINYVSRYLYNHAMFAYWLIRLQHECEKKKKLDWTPPANHAWNVLKFLIENAPVLKQPKNYGRFAMKSDACPYGVGSVLYQEQYDKETKKWEWVIIDTVLEGII